MAHNEPPHPDLHSVQSFLARLDKVQEELLYYPLASAFALASASALVASELAKC